MSFAWFSLWQSLDIVILVRRCISARGRDVYIRMCPSWQFPMTRFRASKSGRVCPGSSQRMIDRSSILDEYYNSKPPDFLRAAVDRFNPHTWCSKRVLYPEYRLIKNTRGDIHRSIHIYIFFFFVNRARGSFRDAISLVAATLQRL